jgi:hypothetical protein
MGPRQPDGAPTTKQKPRQQDTSPEAPNGMLDPFGQLGEKGGADPPHERSGPPQLGPPKEVPPTSATKGMIPGRGTWVALEGHRRRQVARLATIALVRASYGPSVDSRLVPPGPEVCPRLCAWCHPRAAAS